jgi:hypothetical protein
MMGGKGGARPTTGADSITWGPVARQNGWGWDAEQPAAAAPDPAQAAAAPEQPAPVQEQAGPSQLGEPATAAAPTQAQDTQGSIQTTQDPGLGSTMAQAIAPPSMWTDQLKAQGFGGDGSMTTTGQV